MVIYQGGISIDGCWVSKCHFSLEMWSLVRIQRTYFDLREKIIIGSKGREMSERGEGESYGEVGLGAGRDRRETQRARRMDGNL